MATRAEHYKKAEDLLEQAETSTRNPSALVERAKAHAALAGVPMEVSLDAGNFE